METTIFEQQLKKRKSNGNGRNGKYKIRSKIHIR